MDFFTPIFAAAGDGSTWPFVVLVLSVASVIVLISVCRIHAFLALILAALLAGVLAEKLPGGRPRVSDIPAPDGVALKSHYLRAVELVTEEFGKTAGGIGIVIGLASIISMCLMDSGAADKVVRRFLAFFGEKRAGFALLIATYFLSIPIFFDTMFMLMAPLAMALALRTGKDYLLYVLAVCAGGVITHSLTVPHPGPLAMVDNLKVDVGISIIGGVAMGLIPAIGGYFVAKWLNARISIPVREVPGVDLNDLKSLVNKPENQLPGFTISILPIILPIVLITFGSFLDVAWRTYNQLKLAGTVDFHWAKSVVELFGSKESFLSFFAFFEFLGNKNIALLVGAALSIYVLAKQKGYTFSKIADLIGKPLETAGVIILITSAGGAFGLMLKNAGVGDAIKAMAEGKDVNLILLSWLVAIVIRIAQGSATVAMLTTSAMIFPMIDPNAVGAVELPYSVMYIFLSIGFGAFACSWMNDSGFWVVSKLGGLTEKETLKSWTVMLTACAIFGLIMCLVMSKVMPMKGLGSLPALSLAAPR